MATLLQSDQVERPTGSGYEGQGPAVDLPSTGPAPVANEPLRITVHPNSPAPKEPVTPISSSTDWDKINTALSQGYSRDEIANYMQSNLNISKDEADLKVIESVQSKIDIAKQQGYNDNEIRSHLLKSKYDPSIVESALGKQKYGGGVDLSQLKWDPNTPVEEAQDIADLYKSIYSKYSTMGKQVGGVFSQEMGKQARQEVYQLNVSIANKLKEQNIDAFVHPDTGELMMNDQGRAVEVDSSMLNDMFNRKNEFTGAIAGAIAGAELGAKAPLRAKPFTIPGGAILGGMVGVAAGRAADMAVSATLLKEDLEAKLYLTQMTEAAIFDGVAGVVGSSIFKMGGAGYKMINKAYDFMVAGNTKGAYKALLDNMLITDDQAKEIISLWEKQTGTTAPGDSFEEQAIKVITATQQGAEAFVNYAASKDAKSAMRVISEIDSRAKDLLKLTDEVADDNIGSLMRGQLDEYAADVKNFYGEVKDVATSAINGTDFMFDYEKLAMKPVIDSLEKAISNPSQRERYLFFAEKVAKASEDRSFSGLLNLREVINGYKYSKNNLSYKDMEALNNVINKIDGQIGKAVKTYMPDNGADWIKQFNLAKKEYAKMKQLEQNMLYKVLTRKGVTENAIQLGLKKYIDSLDDTFLAVMEKLPAKTRAKAEGAVVKQYIDRYTLGHATDQQAVHFPMISRALENVNIVTPEAKYLKENIDNMAKVFKNDVNLSKVSGNMAVPKFQSYLTTDPVVRLKFEVASGIFNFIKTKLPTKQSDNLALLRYLENALEDPLHVSTVDKLIKQLPKESKEEMRSLFKELQIEMAKTPNKVNQDFKNMYKQSASGKLTVTDGALGKGVYLVDKVKNPNPASKVIRKEVNMSKLATIQDISSLVGREVTEKEIRTLPGLQKQLLDKGFTGIRVEGKAMLFPETTLGAKTPNSIPTKTGSNEFYDGSEDVFYHASPGHIDRPTGPAHFFGDEDFMWQNGKPGSGEQFGNKVTKYKKPKNILELKANDPKSQAVAYQISAKAYGAEEADKALLAGDKEAFAELYEAWADSDNVLEIIDMLGLDGIKFQNEYIVPQRVIQKLEKVGTKKYKE